MDSLPQRRIATLAAALACAAATVFLVAILLDGHVDLPRALPFLAVWTAAPYLAVLGTRLRSKPAATGIVAIALAIELSSYISMGGGFVYALVCGPLLLIALVATGTSRMG
jgi:hypothetical protein